MTVALVTGASSGLGAATARRLAREPGMELVLVARRENLLRALADEIGGASVVAIDLTAEDAPARVREALEAQHGGRLDLLVNNAGGAWRARFADGGYENVRRTMDLNFDAVVRLSEALLPLLRASTPSAMVNITSVAGRVAMPLSGAYNASKFALVGWTEALSLEEREHGVHVGMVLPGFVSTEGFPQSDLTSRAATRWMVSDEGKVAEAVVKAWRGAFEVYAPRPYAAVPRIRTLLPGLYRRVAVRLRRG
jgi:short-subunit dehydrogenase